MNQSRLDELLRWWEISLDGTGDDPYWPLLDYANTKLRDVRYADSALDVLAKQIYDCPAKCPKQFRRWCYRWIDRLAAKLTVTETRPKKARKGEKPFEHERHGDNCFIRLEDAGGQLHVWTIPSTWLPQAQSLWPVHVRHYPNGKPYVSRKVSIIEPDGKRTQRDVAVHRLFLGLSAVRHQVADNLEAQTRDGSWLNYCGGNLSLAAGSDALDRATAPWDVIEYEPLKAFDPRRTWRTPSGSGQ